uniref:Uncharacterized protein n=1 Tax=Plectus sambesii TaxID=2011161 RepID=A0A914XEV7_9BILA
MGERELQQSAATVNKCCYIQEPDPLAHTAAVSSLTPMETVEADAENAIPFDAANIDTAVFFDRPTTDLTDPTKADQLKEMEADSAESNCQKVSATDEQIKPAATGLQNCPNCLNSRVILVKYGSRPGEKRHKCCKCHRWFGDVVKGAVVDKSEVRAPPPKKVRKNQSVSQEGFAPPENQLTSFPVSTTATTSSQTDSDDLFMASFKEQMADTTSFDKDDAICLRRKLKMAQIMLRESRVKIGAVEKQRDDAFKVLRKLHTTVCQFKVDFHANMQRLQEDQSFLANEYATYLKELARGVQKERQAFDAEKARVKLMFDHCETKRRDLKVTCFNLI